MMTANDVLTFWFDELNPSQWYVSDPELDQDIHSRFSETHRQAIACELYSWRDTAEGRLAEIIVLDQFSRHCFRGKPEAFAYDPLALALSQAAISAGQDLNLPPEKRAFLYLPFMHSESRTIHERAIELFTDLGQSGNLDYEIQHKAVIDRFGRYPHRNEVLGRVSTAEEIEFLKQPGSRF